MAEKVNAMFHITTTVAYIMLGISIACELVSASFTTASKGWTVPVPTAITISGYALSYFFFGLCLSEIDLSIGYATWGAVGTIVTPIVGRIIYKQRMTRVGVFAIILIIISVVALNLYG
ncbi:MAG: DMT family transporter [Anaerovoracaceae bacterium]